MLGAEKFMTHNFFMDYTLYHKIFFFVLDNALVLKFYHFQILLWPDLLSFVDICIHIILFTI